MTDEEKKIRKSSAAAVTNMRHSIRRRERIRQHRIELNAGAEKRLPILKAEKIHFKCMMCGKGFRKGKPTDAEMCPPCLTTFRKLRER